MAPDLDQRRQTAAAPTVAPVAKIMIGCLVVAIVSLVVVPSTITYDPLTWATWAREIIHLNLDTNGGPAWKPLPVVIDIIFAPLGAAEKWVWLVVARAGALLGVVMAYRLARRLATGAGTGTAAGVGAASRWAGVIAGAIAGAGFLLSESFLEYLTPLGMSEPLLAGLILLAFERHLDDKYAQAYALLFAGLLLRPETFPFFVAYSVFLWKRSKRPLPWMVALFVSLPVFWLLPDYLSTGNWLRSEQRAGMPTQGGPLLTSHPWLAVIESGFNSVVLPIVVGAVIAIVYAVVAFVKRRDDAGERPLQAMAVLCVGWLLEESVITQAHASSGDQRYMIVAYAAGCVLAGVGWVRFVGDASTWLTGRPKWATATVARVAVIAVLLLGSAPFVVSRLDDLSSAIGEVPYQAHKYGELEALIKKAGGRRQILACGPVTVDTYQMPAVAWNLDVHQSQIRIATGTKGIPTTGTVFRTRTTRGSPLLPPDLESPDFRVVATTAQWQLLSTCADLPA